MGVVGTPHLFADDRHHTVFRTVADHFDGVDKVLPLGEQPSEAIFLWQIFDRDVMSRRLALQLELIELLLKSFVVALAPAGSESLQLRKAARLGPRQRTARAPWSTPHSASAPHGRVSAKPG